MTKSVVQIIEKHTVTAVKTLSKAKSGVKTAVEVYSSKPSPITTTSEKLGEGLKKGFDLGQTSLEGLRKMKKSASDNLEIYKKKTSKTVESIVDYSPLPKKLRDEVTRELTEGLPNIVKGAYKLTKKTAHYGKYMGIAQGAWVSSQYLVSRYDSNSTDIDFSKFENTHKRSEQLTTDPVEYFHQIYTETVDKFKDAIAKKTKDVKEKHEKAKDAGKDGVDSKDLSSFKGNEYLHTAIELASKGLDDEKRVQLQSFVECTNEIIRGVIPSLGYSLYEIIPDIMLATTKSICNIAEDMVKHPERHPSMEKAVDHYKNEIAGIVHAHEMHTQHKKAQLGLD